MAIVTDRSDLPKGDTRSGIVPEPDSSLVADILAGMDLHMKAHRDYGDDDVRPMSRPGAVFRHSDAAGCARQLAYKVTKAEVTNPTSVVDRMNMFWGTIIHEHIDDALAQAGYPESAFEVPCGFDEPFVSAGTADLAHTQDGRVLVAEYKTQGGYAYKFHVGERGKAQGPAWGAIVQGSLNATALGADELVIVDVAKELISKGLAEEKGIPDADRGLAGWHYTPEQFVPIAEAEKRRVKTVLDLIAEGKPVPRAIDDPEIPAVARIVDPMQGRWVTKNRDGEVVRSGQYWNKGAGCRDYCGYRDRCVADMAAETGGT